MKFIKIATNPYTSLFLNFIYAAANCVLGFVVHSWWFITIGAYYSLLAITRFCVLMVKRTAGGKTDMEKFTSRITGILLVALSFCLIGVNTLSIIERRGIAFHEIIMITVATYTFAKISIAIVGIIKARNSISPVIRTLRNISLADGFVSIYAMQRSMLVTFPGLQPGEIQLFNVLTGSAVYLIVLFLGINLIGGKYVTMAKSKIVNTGKKIAEGVTDGYKKIENGVVSGYKKIENSVVKGYTKIEDKFVDTYLTKDGETVEEAKIRLKNEHK